MSMVLFICTGNICRSPMAEALFRYRIGESADWEARSAGIGAVAGSPASSHAVEVLREMGVDLSGHRSQPVSADLVEKSKLIVTMSEIQRDFILERFPEVGGKVCLINSFRTSKTSVDVADPFGGALSVYKSARDEIDRALAALILFIRTERN